MKLSDAPAAHLRGVMTFPLAAACFPHKNLTFLILTTEKEILATTLLSVPLALCRQVLVKVPQGVTCISVVVDENSRVTVQKGDSKGWKSTGFYVDNSDVLSVTLTEGRPRGRKLRRDFRQELEGPGGREERSELLDRHVLLSSAVPDSKRDIALDDEEIGCCGRAGPWPNAMTPTGRVRR
ncbi:hypothetical protein [Streptomyces chartreusis]|uniref:hypothetical protein n=1 Tax=Streptomyces chartreusis TaxID=1969 RepID=UPI0021008BBC|nr:hypothetical protein [Streptomyces chartreusis]